MILPLAQYVRQEGQKMSQFHKNEPKVYTNTWDAMRGKAQPDLAVQLNTRLTNFIAHFNRFARQVQDALERHNIRDDELDGEMAEMRNAVELLQAGSYQGDMRNGYLEQMFLRMYEDLVRLIDERFAQYGFTQDAQIITDSPTPHQGMRKKLVTGDSDIAQRPEAFYASTDSDSESESDMSPVSDSNSFYASADSDSSRRSYAEIKYLRGIYPGLQVKEFCVKFGISEQQYYRAMRK
jgi:hypothetical protein